MDAAELALSRGLAAGWRPEPVLRVSEWADRHRMLVAETTREHGSWRTDRTPYLREIMDAMSVHHPARRVVFMKGAQIGGTEMALNVVGYVIHNAPGPMMYVNPTIELAEDTSKDKISPMIQATPELAKVVRENRSRASGNTILEKKFRGGFLKLAGANSAVSLRAKSIRFLLRDEIDAYPDDVDGEGDPLDLSEARTNTFSRNKKILDLSTPTIRDVSKIERAYLTSDQRRYFLACPACGHRDYLLWRDVAHHRIEFEEGRPETAHMVCSGCGAHVDEVHKPAMLAGGEWRPTAAGDGATLGYHLSALYSPLGWLSWAEIADRFLKAKKDPAKLKVWVNTCLGESWREDNDTPDAAAILGRVERYPAEVPAGVGSLVLAVDVQADRLEWKLKGYGDGEESWLIARSAIPGDPESAQVWRDLDEVIGQEWEHESGQKLRVDITVIDSNFLADHVYRFCRARVDRRVFAVRGGGTQGQPLVGRPTASNAYRARLYTLCTDTGKEIVYGRLRISRPQPGVPSPGYMHMPDWIDEDYVAQLTAERPYRKYVRGRGSVRAWSLPGGRRNEALDQEVYALAGLYILGQGFIRGLGARAARYAQPVLGLGAPTGVPGETGPPAPAAPATPGQHPAAPRRGGWVTRWRR